MNTNPVIVCIAKFESDYIEEFVRYHLAIGFKRIFIYDNEDVPTYNRLLEQYNSFINVIHLPYNNYNKGVQFIALDHFIANFMHKDNITHVAHIDIDEFIVLKQHKNISDFINEYIVDNCAGIGMNWRFFGSSNRIEKTNEPLTLRFTMCEISGNSHNHIKTLFKIDTFIKYCSPHDVIVKNGYHIKSTNGSIITGPHNPNIDFNIIQLNHYKCKTLPEFRYTRSRGDASINGEKFIKDNDTTFNAYNINEIEEITAKKFYTNFLLLFDWQFYLDTYPDLRQNGVHSEQQAFQHWITCGKMEGRQSSIFDWQFYLDTYPDLRQNGVHSEHQAFQHWITCGKMEGRQSSIFDWQFYLDKYPDLRQNGVHTAEQSIEHWIVFGKMEGRMTCKL